MSDAFRFRRNDPGRVVELCEPYWDTRTAAALGTAAANPSAWIAERWDGTLFLYSPDRRVAARIRFGD
jgi:hypothetical protein